MLHHVRGHILVFGLCIGLDGLVGRQSLEAKLAHKARKLLAVGAERFAPVPHIPVMHIPALLAVRIGERDSRGGRTGPVRPVGVLRRDHVRQQMVEHTVVAGFQALVNRQVRIVPFPVHPTLLHLVVATPQRQAGAVPQAPDILLRLHSHVLGKGVLFGVDSASEDKILPDQDAVPVTQIIEAFFLVESAAPHPQHIHVGCRRIRNQAFHISVADAGWHGIGRDPVGSLGKDWHTVNHEREGLTPFVRFTPQLHRSQSHLVAAPVQNSFPGFQAHFNLVERLLSKFIWPPESRIDE